MRSLPVLDELSRATRNKVRLGILRGPDVLTLQPPHNRITGRVHPEALQHNVVPAHAAAVGKALLAFSPPAIVDHVIAAGLPAFTPHTITSPDVLRQRLAVIRLTQIATSRNEFECGRAAIAMPVFYGGGRVAAAIELTVGDLCSEFKPAASALSVACRSLSRQLATELHAMNNCDGSDQRLSTRARIPDADGPAAEQSGRVDHSAGHFPGLLPPVDWEPHRQEMRSTTLAGNSTDPGRSVTSKVTAILMAFADGGVRTLTEIAAFANLPTSTAHRLASELVAWRLLERTEDRTYRIALPLRMIAGGYSESEVCSYTLTVMRALPVLDELSRATRNDVRLGILRGTDVLTLQPPHHRGYERIKAESLRHSLIPAHAAASGKALLAFSPPGSSTRSSKPG